MFTLNQTAQDELRKVAEKAAKIKPLINAYNAGRMAERVELMSLIRQFERPAQSGQNQ